MRKVFLDDLPRWEKGSNKGRINWKLSIGYKVNFMYENIEGWIKIIGYDGKWLQIKYLDKPIFMTDKGSFSKCAFGKLLGKITDEFKVEIGQIFKDEKRDIVIIDREYRKAKNGNNEKWYKYTCNICSWAEGWIRECNIFSGNGCSCCYNRTAVLGINTIWDTDRWMVDLGVSEEDAKTHVPHSRKYIYPICPDCGRVKDSPMKISTIYTEHSIGCTCSDKISYPNKFAYSLLNQLNEIYKFDYIEHEYSPNWIKPKRYDNYFIHNGKRYILEMDGGFHFKDNPMRGQIKEESKAIDDYKDKLAEEHGIEVIRIDCKKSDMNYIQQNIFRSELNLFNLELINYDKCEELALSNLVKVACNYWNSRIESALEISKIMKISRRTVIEYLKKGQPLGWCTYNPKEERLKASTKLNKNGKSIEIFIDETSLGTFPSAKEIQRKSEELLGLKIDSRMISDICLGKLKHYKGYTFQYIDKIEQAI